MSVKPSGKHKARQLQEMSEDERRFQRTYQPFNHSWL